MAVAWWLEGLTPPATMVPGDRVLPERDAVDPGVMLVAIRGAQIDLEAAAAAQSPSSLSGRRARTCRPGR